MSANETPMPQMWLDSTLPKTNLAPIDPATGEPDVERFNRLCDLATLYAYSGTEDEEQQAEWRAEYLRLKDGVEFREAPHFIEHRFLMGEGAAAAQRSAGPLPKIYGCHPETWAGMTEEARSRFKCVDADAENAKTLGSWIKITQ